jgi:serine protease Do
LNSILMTMYQDLITHLLSHKKVAVFSHIRPDGDCLGSQIGLCLWLQQNGVEVVAYNQDRISDNLRWLMKFFRVEVPPIDALDKVDAVVFVDGNQLSRFGLVAEHAESSGKPLYMIDHHPFPSEVFTEMVSVPAASSTCELVYGLYMAHNPDQLIPNACKALYTGLVTDTGSFQFDSVTPDTLAAASDLLKRGGFRPNEIIDALYAHKSHGQIALLGRALNTIETHFDGRIASITVTREMFEATGTGPSDTEGFVSYPLSLEGVMGCILFREDEDRIKVSLRSRTNLDVNRWARKINGGGHAKAAAGWVKGDLQEVKQVVLDEGREAVEEASGGGAKSGGVGKHSASGAKPGGVGLKVLVLCAMTLGGMIGVGCGGLNSDSTNQATTDETSDSDRVSSEQLVPGDRVEEGLDSPMREVFPEGADFGANVVEGRTRDASIDQSRSNAITRAVQKASPAIVSITVTELQTGYATSRDPFFSFFFERPVQREVQSMGSGFIISEDGLIVTNEHVANPNAKTIMVTLPNGSSYEAEILGSDELADLALLKITSDTTSFPYVEFASTEDLMVGEWAVAMGNPFGLFSDGQPTVTVGVISATKRDFRPDPQEPRVYIDMIQTDAAINRGNSGGPLVNSNGQVIGVNTFIFTGGTSSGFVGLGFAIPSERVQKIIEQLKTSGEVQLSFDAGMEFTPMTRQLVYQYGLPPVPGLFVLSVNKNGPAYESGVLPGDIILRIGEERVASEMHAWALMREYEEGDKMSVRLFREGKEYETDMMLRRKATQ